MRKRSSDANDRTSVIVVIEMRAFVVVIELRATAYCCFFDDGLMMVPNEKASIEVVLSNVRRVAKKRYQAVGYPCNSMLKLSSSRGIRIDVPVLSVSWSFEDHSVITQALR